MSFSTHIAAEGLRLPPIKLYSNYEINEDFLAIIMNNTRTRITSRVTCRPLAP